MSARAGCSTPTCPEKILLKEKVRYRSGDNEITGGKLPVRQHPWSRVGAIQRSSSHVRHRSRVQTNHSYLQELKTRNILLAEHPCGFQHTEAGGLSVHSLFLPWCYSSNNFIVLVHPGDAVFMTRLELATTLTSMRRWPEALLRHATQLGESQGGTGASSAFTLPAKNTFSASHIFLL